MYKKRDPRAKLLFCVINPIAFLTSWLPSPSLLLKLPNNCCKRGCLLRSRERDLNGECRVFKTRLIFCGIRCLWIDHSVPLLISMLDWKSAQGFQKYLNQTIIFFLVRYSLKVMEAGTDKALLDQKMYFANGGVYSVVIQPNPSKKDKVRI